MKKFARLVVLPLAALIIGAAPAAREIPFPLDEAEALVIPADSPVQFERFDKNGVAHFRGLFELRGSFVYGCAIDCEERPKDRFYRMDFTYDRGILDRLPRWRVRGSVPSIVITNERAFVRGVASARQYAGLQSGKIADIRGRADILVDHFAIGIDCDGPSLSARFVRLLDPPRLAADLPDGNPGCG
jgi:hypothetical protein